MFYLEKIDFKIICCLQRGLSCHVKSVELADQFRGLIN